MLHWTQWYSAMVPWTCFHCSSFRWHPDFQSVIITQPSMFDFVYVLFPIFRYHNESPTHFDSIIENALPWVMGHGSWVKYSVGHMGHGSLKVTHRLRKCFLVIHCIYNILHFRFGWWKPKPVLASKLLGSRISQLFLENFWFLVVWNRMFWCIVGRLDVGPVIRSRIRISDYCSNSLAIAGYGILRDLLASSHTVAGRFSRNSLKWLKPTRKWSTTFWSASAAETWTQINPGIWIRIPDHCWLRQRKFKGSGQKCEFSNCSVRLS